jgi:hypothetical protein
MALPTGQVFHLVTKVTLSHPVLYPGQSLCRAEGMNRRAKDDEPTPICKACDGIRPHIKVK